ncbi:MAG: DinB family protein [Acidimicrobiales bacterium]|jgi:hypothetical protein
MNEWGPLLYGDPCRACGFEWSMSTGDAVSLVANMPPSLTGLLEGRSGGERHPDLAWSAAGYVCHVGDNLRIWAERLIGVIEGASPVVRGYDENELADARNYESIPLPAALWSLTRSTGDWLLAVQRSTRPDIRLVHPERGELTLADVVSANAHDAHHHRWDIERIVDVSGH